MQIEDSGKKSVKDISDRWLDYISNSFEKLRLYEQVLRDGCSDLFEYIDLLKISNPTIILNQAKIKSVEMMINEFDILFNDIEVVIEGKLMTGMREKLEVIEKIFSKEEIYETSHNETKRPPVLTRVILTKHFFDARDKLTSLRRDLIINSKHLLFVQDKKKVKEKER